MSTVKELPARATINTALKPGFNLSFNNSFNTSIANGKP